MLAWPVEHCGEISRRERRARAACELRSASLSRSRMFLDVRLRELWIGSCQNCVTFPPKARRSEYWRRTAGCGEPSGASANRSTLGGELALSEQPVLDVVAVLSAASDEVIEGSCSDCLGCRRERDSRSSL